MYRKLDRMLTIKDVTNMLPIGRDLVLQMFHLPDFPKIQINRRYFVMESELEEWLKTKSAKKLKLKGNSKKKGNQKQKGDDSNEE